MSRFYKTRRFVAPEEKDEQSNPSSPVERDFRFVPTFEFIPRGLEQRDLRYTTTYSGEIYHPAASGRGK